MLSVFRAPVVESRAHTPYTHRTGRRRTRKVRQETAMKLPATLCLTLVAAVCVVHAADSVSIYRDRGWDALKKKHYRAASEAFLRAGTQGMSRDSLLLLLAEVYTRKGVLDTALGFNHAASPDTGSQLLRTLLQQRYRIYTALGLPSHARKTREQLGSLRSRSADGRKPYLPIVRARAELGYERLSDSLGIRQDERAGPTWRGSLGSIWKVPFVSTSSIGIGLKGEADRPAWASKEFPDIDSLTLSLGAGAGIYDIGGTTTIEYAYERTKSYQGTYTSLHDFSAMHHTALSSTLLFTVAGYSLELDNDLSSAGHYAWVSEYLTRPGARRFSVDAALTASAAFLEPLIDSTHEIVVLDRTAAVFDTLGSSVLLDASGSSAIDLRENISYDQVSLTPTLHGTYRPHPSVRLRGSLSYSYIRYLHDYRWSTSSSDKTLILRDSTGAMYTAPVMTAAPLQDLGELPPFDYFADKGSPLEKNRVTRHDSRVGFAVACRLDLKRAGILSVHADVAHTWTTLPADAPVAVSPRDWSIGLQWRSSLDLGRG